MLKLLTALLANKNLTASIYTPTPADVAIQLTYMPKGILVDIGKTEKGYLVKLFDIPAGQQQPKPVLKAMEGFVGNGTVTENISGELITLPSKVSEEYRLCDQIFDKYFGEEDQRTAADYAAGLLEDKKTKLSVNKGN